MSCISYHILVAYKNLLRVSISIYHTRSRDLAIIYLIDKPLSSLVASLLARFSSPYTSQQLIIRVLTPLSSPTLFSSLLLSLKYATQSK
jgi:hypothetical protein